MNIKIILLRNIIWTTKIADMPNYDSLKTKKLEEPNSTSKISLFKKGKN